MIFKKIGVLLLILLCTSIDVVIGLPDKKGVTSEKSCTDSATPDHQAVEKGQENQHRQPDELRFAHLKPGDFQKMLAAKLTLQEGQRAKGRYLD